jgi:tetratricopeptide (TPR) repeat protein
VLAWVLAGCAARFPAEDLGPSTAPAELLRAAPLTGVADPAPLPDAELLVVDADMRRFVAEHVSARASRATRLRELLDAVIGSGRFRLDYGDSTLTAAEAFHRREANCLSFTSLFVALAREVGLEANFQEVDIPPDWTLEGGSLVLNRHVDVVVRDDAGRDRVIDFQIEDFRASYDRRRVSDARGFAHYYSNLGVERMQAGDRLGALAYFRKALGADGRFVPAWVNLGSLYLRAGHPDFALASWQHALALDPGEAVALSNLERLHRQQGRTALADEIAGRLEHHRMRNPWYRYFLAQQAYGRGEYDAAIAHLERALREKRGEDRFAALLALSYLGRGDRAAARRWLARAEEIAADDESRRRYQGKLEKLRGGAG